jgi:hypothetical protein
MHLVQNVANLCKKNLKQQRNRSCFGKLNPGQSMTLLGMLVMHELNSMNQ